MVFKISGWIFCFVVMGFWPPLTPLMITHLYVPRGAIHEAPMDCKYDLEGESLYDVKWYKDDMQFFRCLANGSVHEFPLDGITLEYSPRASVGSCHFTLTGLTGNSGGRYKCEVSLDAPTFRTVAQTVDFRVSQPSRRVQDRNNDVSTDDEPIKSSPKPQQRFSDTQNAGISSRPVFNYLVLLPLLLFCLLRLKYS